MPSPRTARCTAPGSRSSASRVAIPGTAAASIQRRDPTMMDTQRLIALIIFSLSALFLWEAWQKHTAPKVPPPASVVPARPGETPIPPPPQAAAPSAGQAPAAPSGTAAVPAGEPVAVRTDVFDIEINTAGGDIRRVTMLEHLSALDRTKPLTLMEPDPKHFYITQTGLIGEKLPNHKTLYQAEKGSY